MVKKVTGKSQGGGYVGFTAKAKKQAPLLAIVLIVVIALVFFFA
jgi:hypothetical protein